MNRALALVLASAVIAACASDDGGGSAARQSGEPRTIDVSMTDMAFTPGHVEVAAGETVRFVFRNDGAVRHEALIGDMAEQEEHHREMAESGGSHHDPDTGSTPHHGGERHSVVVEPRETAELTHTFDAAGPTMIGCHEPGHWEAGMRMTIGL
ncbi:MAG: cupredoxin domain-containing protein [Acidimicrobiia bacterium]|nr:cupredoxin domain-containing protein [Acidimicrobiia bacterium]